MKFLLRTNLSPDQVEKRMPSFAHRMPLPTLDPNKKYTLVVFRQSISVVLSQQIAHALKKVPDDNIPIIVAENLTDEANKLVQQANGEIICDRSFGWTDESYYNITNPQKYPS